MIVMHKMSDFGRKFLHLCFFIYASVLSSINIFAQGEEIGPLTANPDLFGTESKAKLEKSNPGTFDSTFIYFSDTLNLPFLDEFSKNHFESYNAGYTDPGVTFDKKYRMLDNTTLLPIGNNLFFTDQQTFRRIYDVTTSTYVDESFPPTAYKVGDLSTYPVNYATMDLYPPYFIYDTIGTIDVSDTIWIPSPPYFQDSATQFFKNLSNPDAFWLDSRAYWNFRFAYEPRTLGVVSFDGLNENGYPYAIGTTSTNYADFLTSKPLDMAPYNAADSVYFSFLYQAEGFGDIPEAGDSLVLEFYAKDLDQWIRVWSSGGYALEPFKVGHIKISDPKYFKKGFQFRFKNYGAMSGMLDHFHLDYVHLRALSGYQDTLFKDFAFVYPVGSLLKSYTSVPWDHFKNNPNGKMNDAAEIVVHNGSNIMENNQNGKIEVFYNNLLEGSYTLNAQTLSGGAINYGPQTTYTSYFDLSGGYVYDNTKTGTKETFDVLATASAQFPNLAQNDSTWSKQYFANYYSYDDGTAEAAYGPTGTQARLAIRYNAYESDSVIGLSMHFVPSVNNVSNKLFLLTVWADAGGAPGAVLYEDNIFFPRQPSYGSAQNQFINYFFKDTMKVAVGNTFYVGWRQFDADRLNIGLDRNLDHSDNTFYSVNGGVTWVQSLIPGSVMIRPIFSTGMDPELGVESLSKSDDFIVYPNPTEDMVTIRTNTTDYDGVDLFTIDGQHMLESKDKFISLVNYPSGIYLLRIKGSSQTFKIIKK